MLIAIRNWKYEDLNSLVLHANNIKIWNNLRNYFPHPYTEEDGKAWLEKVVDALPAVNMAIDVNGQAVGGIGLILNGDVYIKSAEIGYWLGEKFWNKGIITKALNQVVEIAFNEFNIERVFARPFGTNKASQKVLEKCGFEQEAILKKTIFKNGDYIDELIYSKRKK